MASVVRPTMRLAGEADVAFDAIGLADDGLEQRRFSGAVGADDGDDLAGADRDIDMVDRTEFLVENRHVFDGQQRGSMLSLPCRITSRDRLLSRAGRRARPAARP